MSIEQAHVILKFIVSAINEGSGEPANVNTLSTL